MQTKEYCQFWHHPQLDVGLLQAYHVDYAYPRHSHDHYVICVVDWIEAHFAGPISLADLANYVVLSPYYLLRVFHEQVGLPPHAYLQDVRIRRAQRLIELGKPLAEVTFAVGFSSQSHLTRRFKQIVGTTPGQYANQVRPANEA
jgi:AraC-like DNA-binding protein